MGTLSTLGTGVEGTREEGVKFSPHQSSTPEPGEGKGVPKSPLGPACN